MEDLEARVCELEATVAALRDRAEIQDLRFRYHIAVNEKELDSIGSLFSVDGEAHFGEIGSARGRAEIEALYAEVVGSSPFVKQFIHNHVITLNGDTASGLSYLEAKTVANGESYLVAARFNDEYVREGGEWKFSLLKLSIFFVVPLREGWAGENKIRLPS
ncbi:MAG: nuclear transport factor 2 family protein [Myxococcota bacterium]